MSVAEEAIKGKLAAQVKQIGAIPGQEQSEYPSIDSLRLRGENLVKMIGAFKEAVTKACRDYKGSAVERKTAILFLTTVNKAIGACRPRIGRSGWSKEKIDNLENHYAALNQAVKAVLNDIKLPYEQGFLATMGLKTSPCGGMFNKGSGLHQLLAPLLARYSKVDEHYAQVKLLELLDKTSKEFNKSEKLNEYSKKIASLITSDMTNESSQVSEAQGAGLASPAMK